MIQVSASTNFDKFLLKIPSKNFKIILNSSELKTALRTVTSDEEKIKNSFPLSPFKKKNIRVNEVGLSRIYLHLMVKQNVTIGIS